MFVVKNFILLLTSIYYYDVHGVLENVTSSGHTFIAYFFITLHYYNISKYNYCYYFFFVIIIHNCCCLVCCCCCCSFHI